MPDDHRPQPAVPRQRWRITFRRDEDARFLAHLDAMKLWERALRRAGIPVANTEGFNPRPRIVFAAPLPLGMLAEREIVDVVLSERLTVADLRERLERDLPAGFTLVALYDVWLNAPSVASQLASATYLAELAGADGQAVRAAVASLLAAEHVPRIRQKEKRSIAYDLRPLVVAVDVVEWNDARAATAARVADSAGDVADGRSGSIRIVLLHSQDAGTGRPEEVVAELAARAGLGTTHPTGSGAPDPTGGGLVATRLVRERLTLVDGA
jgi:radical SAM-linked protein